MHSLQNGTRCTDGGKCCGVIPIQFGWFLMVSSLHVVVLLQKTFCDSFLLLFFALSFRNGKREKNSGRGGQGEDAWSINYDNIEFF